jgi:hypothetical protein
MMTYHLMTFIGAALVGAGLMLVIGAIAVVLIHMVDND